MSAREVVGFIGAGQLGEPMVHRLCRAGHEVRVAVRREKVARRLIDSGATVVSSVADLAESSDVIISCLFSDEQLTELASGPDGFVARARAGTVVISHTTGTAGTLTTLRDGVGDAGPTILDAPVSGTADDIAAGRLTVLIGGPIDAVDRATPILAAYADPVVHTGGPGTALQVKLVNNLLFAANAQLVFAATELGTRLGIEPAALISAVSACSGHSAALTRVGQMGTAEVFDELAGPFLRKDVAACAAAAREAGVDLGLLGSVVERGRLDL